MRLAGKKCFTASFFLAYGQLMICVQSTGQRFRGAAGDYGVWRPSRLTSSAANCAAALKNVYGCSNPAFDLLCYLVQHRDRVVSKDDLLQAVWGGRIVSNSALTTRIRAVRRAVGDDGRSCNN